MSEKRFKQLMEKVTNFAIFFMDADGIIEEWNIGAENLFGYKRSEAIGQNADLIFTPRDRAERACDKERLIAAEKGIAEDERWHMRSDGTFFFASGLLQAVY